MRRAHRLWPLALVCIIPVACGPSPGSAPSVEGGIDYAGWPAVTEKPFEVPEHVFRFCRPPEEGAKEHGPHFAPAMRVFANPTGFEAVRAGSTPMPVGSVVVKEKWWNKEGARPDAYAAMVKREAGY